MAGESREDSDVCIVQADVCELLRQSPSVAFYNWM